MDNNMDNILLNSHQNDEIDNTEDVQNVQIDEVGILKRALIKYIFE